MHPIIFRTFIIISSLLISTQAYAKYFLDFEYGTAYDKSSQFASGKNSQTLFLGEVSFQFSKNSDYFFNAGYMHFVTVEPISNTDTSSFSNDIPFAGLKACFFANDLICTSLNYSPYGQSIYSQTGTSIYESWINKTFMGVLTIRPKISFRSAITFNLYYLNINYSQKKISTGITPLTTDESVTRTVILPTIGVEYEF